MNTDIAKLPARAAKPPAWRLTLAVRCPFYAAMHGHCGGYGVSPQYGVYECHLVTDGFYELVGITSGGSK